MNETTGLMKAQPLRSEEATLSPGEAVEAFRTWVSAELLTKQRHWLGAESRRQKRSKADLLTEALGLWVGRHPEERLTRPQLFNVMRAAVGEFMTVPPPGGGAALPAGGLTPCGRRGSRQARRFPSPGRASDPISARATKSARRPFVKFAPEAGDGPLRARG
jgi:hypothetical protein